MSQDSDDSREFITDPSVTDPPVHPALSEVMLQLQRQQFEFQQQMTTFLSKIASPRTDSRDDLTSRTTRSSKPTRPTIDADSSDNTWIIFQDSWKRYKEMACLTDVVEIRNELRSTCTPKVNEMLFNFVGPDALQNVSEGNLLKFIKSVAVKSVHSEVYRQQFFSLKQNDCESITCYISRLKAQAMLCSFKTKGECGAADCSPSYASDMIRSQLIAGLRNRTHQSKVLSEISTLKTLEQLTTRLLALEVTDRASSQFHSPFESDTSGVNPVKSNPYNKTRPDKKKSCFGCGKSFHPGGRSTCPAWQKTCNKCKKPNHFASVCRGSPASGVNGVADEADESFSQLSSIATKPL